MRRWAVLAAAACAVAAAGGDDPTRCRLRAGDWDDFRVTARMDTEYNDGLTRRLVTVHGHRASGRLREDYHTITSAALLRHHTSIHDFGAGQQTLISSRMAHRGAVAPATCMVIPGSTAWPLGGDGDGSGGGFQWLYNGTAAVEVEVGLRAIQTAAFDVVRLTVAVGRGRHCVLLGGQLQQQQQRASLQVQDDEEQEQADRQHHAATAVDAEQSAFGADSGGSSDGVVHEPPPPPSPSPSPPATLHFDCDGPVDGGGGAPQGSTSTSTSSGSGSGNSLDLVPLALQCPGHQTNYTVIDASTGRGVLLQAAAHLRHLLLIDSDGDGDGGTGGDAGKEDGAAPAAAGGGEPIGAAATGSSGRDRERALLAALFDPAVTSTLQCKMLG